MVAPLLQSERAKIVQQSRVNGAKLIAAVQITEKRPELSQMGLRPGSYGIERVHSPFGIYFQHHQAWEMVA